MEGGIERGDLRRASALVSAGAVAPGWLTSPGIAAAAAPRRAGRAGAAVRDGQGRRPLPALDARDRPLGRAAGRGQRARGDGRVGRDGHRRHHQPRGHPRGPGPRPGRVLRPLRHRARARCSRTRAALAASSREPRRPVRRQRPDRRPRRRAGRHPARRRARPRPARALRRRLQPPRGRRLARRLDLHARSAGPTTATAATCRSRASCAPSSRSTPTWGSWASRATS